MYHRLKNNLIYQTLAQINLLKYYISNMGAALILLS